MSQNDILVCALDPELRLQLETAMSEAGHSVTSVAGPAEAVAAVRSGAVDLVIAEGLAASGAIGSLRAATDGRITPVLVIAAAHDVEARIAFLEAGADDVLVAGFARPELQARVTALLIRSGRSATGVNWHGGTGEIIAFFSPKGGVGTTTLAVNTAVLLSGGDVGGGVAGDTSTNGAVPSSRVLIIDLDLQFGQVATHLNLLPRYDLAGLATDEAALADPEHAGAYLTLHGSGLAVLAAPTRPEADFRVTVEALERIVELFQHSFDHIVVDLGSRLDQRSLWLLEQADAHVFVLFPEIAALRSTTLLMAFLADSTPLEARTHFVINHVFPKELLKTRDVENLLRAAVAAEVPYTEIAMIRAVNEGVPLVLSRPTSPAALAIRRIAQAVIGAEQPVPSGQPRRRWSLGGRRGSG